MNGFLKVSSVNMLIFSILFSVATVAAQPSLPEPQWDPDHYFPRFNEPETVYVFNVPNAMVDWWGVPSSMGWRITDSPETMDALTIVGLQSDLNAADNRHDRVGDIGIIPRLAVNLQR